MNIPGVQPHAPTVQWQLTMKPDDSSKPWPYRRSIRIKGYDYAQEGAYFITICTHKNKCTLGRIVGDDIILNDYGRIVLREWNRSSVMRAEIELDAFIIMPNHVHGIVFIHPVGARGRAPGSAQPDQSGQSLLPGVPKRSLSSLILGFKTSVTTQINRLRVTPGKPFWQRNYYEHIIRNEESLYQCRIYIEQNPLKWAIDNENPDCRLSM